MSKRKSCLSLWTCTHREIHFSSVFFVFASTHFGELQYLVDTNFVFFFPLFSLAAATNTANVATDTRSQNESAATLTGTTLSIPEYVNPKKLEKPFSEIHSKNLNLNFKSICIGGVDVHCFPGLSTWQKQIKFRSFKFAFDLL